MKSSQRGFTLIELLVVIAVIGILAAVVLASLNSAREKGKIAAIKSNLRNISSEAEILYSENGTYIGLCSNSKVLAMIAAVTATGAQSSCYLHSAAAEKDWGVAAILGTNTFFTAGPGGILILDTANISGSTMIWDDATAACASVGKRMPNFSGLKALYDINGAMPTGFMASQFWTSTEHVSTVGNVYNVNMSTGVVASNTKSALFRVRCGS